MFYFNTVFSPIKVKKIMVKSSPINGDNQDDESHKSSAEKPNLKGDRLNFSLLMILYIIQGFPIGLSSALPVILQSNPMITFADQVCEHLYFLKLFSSYR